MSQLIRSSLDFEAHPFDHSALNGLYEVAARIEVCDVHLIGELHQAMADDLSAKVGDGDEELLLTAATG